MKKVNPLYILSFVLLLLIFVGVKLSKVSKDKDYLESQLAQNESIALEITALKKSWAASKKNSSSLDRLIRSSSLRSANLKTKKKRDSYTISSESIDSKSVDFLLSKIYNGTYMVKKLYIKRVTPHSVSLKMEIAL